MAYLFLVVQNELLALILLLFLKTCLADLFFAVDDVVA